MSEQWPRDKIFALIHSFRENECLWKVSSKQYLDRTARNDALRQMADSLGCDVRTLEKKLKTLRTQFLNCYKEARKKSSGSVADDSLKPKWFAYDALKFLIHRNPKSDGKKKVATRINSETKTSYNSDFNLDLEMEDHHTEDATTVPNCYSRNNSSNSNNADVPFVSDMSNSISKAQMLMRRKNNLSTDLHEVQESHRLITPLQDTLGRDEFTVFGEHVAYRLRSISNVQARLIAQYRINNILFEAEISKFHHPKPTSAGRTNSDAPTLQHRFASTRNSSLCSNTPSPEYQKEEPHEIHIE